MRSRIAIAGHPLHPMLVPLPIGLLVGSVIADAVYIFTGYEEMWANIAFWTLIGGVASALLAASAGFGEFWLMARHTDARELSIWHMALNLAATGLFTASIIVRLDEVSLSGVRFGAAFTLSLVALLAMSVSGWLGGELSYRKHLGVAPDTAQDEEGERRRHLVPR